MWKAVCVESRSRELLAVMLQTPSVVRLVEALQSEVGQVTDSFELLTGQSVREQSVLVEVQTGDELFQKNHFGTGPLAIVECSVHGDVEGDFLLIQRHTDFLAFSSIMESYLVNESSQGRNVAGKPPFWLEGSWGADGLPRRFRARMTDVLSETGNMLFGTFLLAIYREYGLATYQGIPRATIFDDQQLSLQDSISRNRRESNFAVVIDIESRVSNRTFHTWLIFMPLVSGVTSLLTPRRPNLVATGPSFRAPETPRATAQVDAMEIWQWGC